MADNKIVENAIMGSPAAQRFSNTTELLCWVGSKVSSKSSLASLCLVNKQFRDVFSQFLYRRITLTHTVLQPERIWSLINNPSLRLTQALTFDPKDDFDIPPPDQSDLWHPRGMKEEDLKWIVGCVSRVIPRCPNLHTLRIVGTMLYESHILQLAEILTNPRNPPLLQCLALDMENYDGDRQFRRFTFHPTRFTQGTIRSLCLMNITDQHMGTPGYKGLCTILAASPQLQYLALSCSGYRGLLPRSSRFRDLCKHYKEIGGAPLKLRVLHLGRSLVLEHPSDYQPVPLPISSMASTVVAPPAWPASPSTIQGVHFPPRASYISLLTDEKCLEELYATTYDEHKTYPGHSPEFAWGTLSSSMLPKLKTLHVDTNQETGKDFVDFLRVDGTLEFLNRLHIHLSGTRLDRNRFGNLKRMSKTILRPYEPRNPSTAFSPRGFSFLNKSLDESRYKYVEPLRLPDTATLSISVYYPRLGNFVRIGLSKMGQLESLMLELYVPFDTEWDVREEVDRKQTQAVILAARACPKLRYVKMEMCYDWNSWRTHMGEMNQHARVLEHQELYPLIDLRRSWAIVRETVGDIAKVKARLLDAKEDEALCPEELWSQARIMDQYVVEKALPFQAN